MIKTIAIIAKNYTVAYAWAKRNDIPSHTYINTVNSFRGLGSNIQVVRVGNWWEHPRADEIDAYLKRSNHIIVKPKIKWELPIVEGLPFE